jgi:hypothetical protein
VLNRLQADSGNAAAEGNSEPGEIVLPSAVYPVWLVGYALALLLTTTGALLWLCRFGRVRRPIWIVWTLASLVSASFLLIDLSQRFSGPVDGASALLVQLFLVTAFGVSCSLVVWRGLRFADGAASRPQGRISLTLLAVNLAASILVSQRFYGDLEAAELPEVVMGHGWSPQRVEHHLGLTDHNNSIRLYVPSDVTIDEATHQRILDPFRERVIATEQSRGEYNCHGWVFTDGKYILAGNDVERILADNGYREVEHPASGDLIVYRDYSGGIVHTGLVRAADDRGLVLIESKWGLEGRYLHQPQDQIYGQTYTYYHSHRAGHLLKIGDSAQAPHGSAAVACSEEPAVAENCDPGDLVLFAECE